MSPAPGSLISRFEREERRRYRAGLRLLLVGALWVGNYIGFVLVSFLGLAAAFSGSSRRSTLALLVGGPKAASLVAGVAVGMLAMTAIALGIALLAGSRWTARLLGAWLAAAILYLAGVLLSMAPAEWPPLLPVIVAWCVFAAGIVWAVRVLDAAHDPHLSEAPSNPVSEPGHR